MKKLLTILILLCSLTSFGQFGMFQAHNRSYQISDPFVFAGQTSSATTFSNPGLLSITTTSETNLLIIVIANTHPSILRETTAPSFNGDDFTQVGSWAGLYPIEMWYLKNPSTGTYNISVPNNNGGNLRLLSKWYSSDDSSYLFYQATNVTPSFQISVSTNVSTPNDKKILVVDGFRAIAESFSGNDLNIVSSTDDHANYIVGGASAGGGSQSGEYTATGTSRNMGWTNDDPMQWHHIVACFTVL